MNVSVIIAALRFIFGLITWIVEQRAHDRADRRQARAELTGILSDLTALPRQYSPLLAQADDVLEQNLYNLYTQDPNGAVDSWRTAEALAVDEDATDTVTVIRRSSAPACPNSASQTRGATSSNGLSRGTESQNQQANSEPPRRPTLIRSGP